MLGVKSYPAKYVAACREGIARQLALYDGLPKAAKTDDFATAFFADLVMVLELSFVHRVRMQEGKDGNPLNEVRLLAMSLMENDGVMGEDKTIKWNAAKSVTGTSAGDQIAISRDSFETLAEAFFAEIEKKYG